MNLGSIKSRTLGMLRRDASLAFCLLATLQLLVSLSSHFLSVTTRFPYLNIDVLLLDFAPLAGFVIGGVSVVLGGMVIASELYGYKYIFFSVPEFLNNVRFFPTYLQMEIIGGLVLLLIFFVFLYRLKSRQVPGVKNGHVLLGFLLAFVAEASSGVNAFGSSYLTNRLQLMAAADYLVKADLSESFAPIEHSRSREVALEALGANMDVIVVIVESLGELKDPGMQKQIDDALIGGLAQQGFHVEKSVVPFEGSTIHGEFRELCSSKLKNVFFSNPPKACLPELFGQAGYRVTAYHGNDSRFYRRGSWYPRIGFDEIIDIKRLARQETSFCGGLWNGFCDLDLFNLVFSEGGGDTRRFDYILTLNTHMPPEPMTRGVGAARDCAGRFPGLVCVHLDNTLKVLNGLSGEIGKRKNTAVIVAGDHAPPFLLDHDKQFFYPDRVPLYVITPNGLDRKK